MDIITEQSQSLDMTGAARGFAAVGSPARLRVLLELVRAGPVGLNVGQIRDRTGMPASTLAHHLRYLDAGGLISQQKAGRSVISRAEFSHLEALAGYILSECCIDQGGHGGSSHE